ncbi:MAG: alpha/beta fold hydrolase [Promethearchaeota archaeon]
MPYFTNDGVKIHYEIEGEGPTVVMIHGFASSLEGNWKQTNWVNFLKDKYQLILIDCRGHGKSDKPTDPSQYGLKMTDDIIKLLEHLKIEKANFLGYSMGSQLTLTILLSKPQLMKCAILGGFVISFGNETEQPLSKDRRLQIIEALKAESKDQIKNPVGLRFRVFAEANNANLHALAAVMGSGLQTQENRALLKERLKKIKVPFMSVVGSDDDLLGDKTLFAQIVPDACHFQIQGKDHLTVVPDPKFKMVVKAFLDYINRR